MLAGFFYFGLTILLYSAMIKAIFADYRENQNKTLRLIAGFAVFKCLLIIVLYVFSAWWLVRPERFVAGCVLALSLVVAGVCLKQKYRVTAFK